MDLDTLSLFLDLRFLALIAIILLTLLSYLMSCPWTGNGRISNQLTASVALIDGSFLKKNGPLSFHISRSIVNRHIADMFHICNGFTDSDPRECQKFKRTAGTILRGFDNTPELMRHAKDVADRTVAFFVSSNNDQKLPLDRLFRVMVFWFMAPQMFPDRVVKIDFHHSLHLTDAVNNLWIASKNKLSFSEPVQKERRQLFAALKEMFPEYDCTEPKSSPLNLIIPSYETMWRVVLLCFLEVTYRRRSERRDWQKRLKGFFDNPDESEFRKQSSGISIEGLVLETLRCYPPTKSIYRAVANSNLRQVIQYFGFSLGSPTNSIRLHREIADVQGLHRHNEIWGRYADQFWPYRWCQEDSEQMFKMEKAFLAFGCQPYQCPARKIGPKLIGIMVAAFTEAIGRSYMLEGLRDDGEKLLESGRAVFENVRLKRLDHE